VFGGGEVSFGEGLGADCEGAAFAADGSGRGE